MHARFENFCLYMLNAKMLPAHRPGIFVSSWFMLLIKIRHIWTILPDASSNCNHTLSKPSNSNLQTSSFFSRGRLQRCLRCRSWDRTRAADMRGGARRQQNLSFDIAKMIPASHPIISNLCEW